MAKQFEAFVASDDRFEIPAERHMGMVVFRLKGENEMTEKLLKKLNGSARKLKIHTYFILLYEIESKIFEKDK